MGRVKEELFTLDMEIEASNKYSLEPQQEEEQKDETVR